MELVNPGLDNLVELEVASCCNGPCSRVESDLGDPTGPDHMELWHCTRAVQSVDPINTSMWTEKGCGGEAIISIPAREI